MKKIITILVFLFVGIGAMQAQLSKQKPTIFAKETVASAKKTAISAAAQTIISKLNLDERQIANVTKIMGAFEGMKQRITQSSKTPEQTTQALNEIEEREKSILKNILDDTQYAKYLELASSLKKG